MKISIVVPTYNSETYVAEAIQSILIQNYKDFEVIICDNESTDNTISIIKNKLIGKDIEKFKFFVRSDIGVADALNYGFSRSSGKILCWLNSDDKFFDENVFSKIVKNFQNNHNIDYIVGNFINIDSNGKKIKKFYSYIPKKKIKNFFYYNQIFTGSFFFSKKLFSNFLNFNIEYKYAFEYDLIFFSLKNYNGFYCNIFLAYFRILPNALSANKEKLYIEFNLLLKKYNLKYSNSIIIRFYSHFINGNLLKVIIEKIKFFFKSIRVAF